MSCLTLPPVEYKCVKADEECRLDRQTDGVQRRATFLGGGGYLHFTVYHFIQARTDPVMPTDSKVWFDSSRLTSVRLWSWNV